MPRAPFRDADTGYSTSLRPRHIQMIALGGAIGTGLFMGAGGRLHEAGPILVLVFLLCGIFVFFVLRALGELVLHRPTSGSFVSYAREFFGEKLAFVAGWMVFLNYVMTSIADVTAVALYLRFWGHLWAPLRDTPQWVLALIALAVMFAVNLVAVGVFGELEFWFSIIKVGTLIAFLIVGIVLLVLRAETDAGPVGWNMIAESGGWMPHGILPALVVFTGVVFAYASIELVGVAAGETSEPARVMPRAVNSVILRIAVFYVGSVLLLTLLLPTDQYRAGESPFVTFFARLGSAQTGEIVGSIMNLVVLTAALSGLNAGLYASGRILRSMSVNGSAPRFVGKLSKHRVPTGGITLTVACAVLGVGLNYLLPEAAFEIVIQVASIAVLMGWATIVLCQLRLYRLSRRGEIERPTFRMPGAPWSGYITLAFLGFALGSLGFSEQGRWVLVGSLALIPLLIIGWFLTRGRINAVARERALGISDAPVEL
ncbi:amino acid permease [Mycetocola lacteus]|uniref:amino acid permease n=1 Tax=Mycetocola lacteus TaxID=76637 RepID=UPI001FECE1C6|nr:amino acid permease [Mycetocola lacteus]